MAVVRVAPLAAPRTDRGIWKRDAGQMGGPKMSGYRVSFGWDATDNNLWVHGDDSVCPHFYSPCLFGAWRASVLAEVDKCRAEATHDSGLPPPLVPKREQPPPPDNSDV